MALTYLQVPSLVAVSMGRDTEAVRHIGLVKAPVREHSRREQVDCTSATIKFKNINSSLLSY